jgi:rhodanese-related sulfurtransferase
MKTTILNLLLLCGGLLALGMFARSLAAEPPPEPDRGAVGATVTHVDAAGAATLIRERRVVILDIRTPEEYADGHIAGSTNIDFSTRDFEKRLSALNRTNTYLVHCASGGRSTRSLESFKKLGFKSVVHLDGGFRAWKKGEQPVAK